MTDAGAPLMPPNDSDRAHQDGFDNVENVLSYSQREAIVRGYASKAGFAAVPGLTAVRA